MDQLTHSTPRIPSDLGKCPTGVDSAWKPQQRQERQGSQGCPGFKAPKSPPQNKAPGLKVCSPAGPVACWAGYQKTKYVPVILLSVCPYFDKSFSRLSAPENFNQLKWILVFCDRKTSPL